MADFEEEGEDGEEEEEKKSKWPVSVYVDEGKLHYRLGNLQRAIESFSSVLERQPNNVNMLVNRSKAYYQLMDYDSAMNDVEAALKVNPKSPAAICQKGEIQYIIGDFEFAYLTFARGYKIRPFCQEFRYGFQKCRAAIVNAIGPNSNLRLTDKDVRMVESRLEKKHLQQTTGRKISIVEAEVKLDMTSRVLGEMAYDKKFMEDTLKGKQIHQTINWFDTSMERTIKELLMFLQNRLQFWQMEKPMHNRGIRAIHKQKVTKVTVEDTVLSTLNEIDNLLQQKPKAAIDMCSKMIQLLKETDESELPNRYQLLANTLGRLGNAYRQVSNVKAALEAHEKQKTLAKEKSLDDILYQSISNIGYDHMADNDYSQAKSEFNKQLNVAKCEAEVVSPLVDIARCEMATENYTKAQDLLTMAMEVARDSGNLNLEVKVNVCFGQLKLMERDVNSAICYFENAQMLAVIADDSTTATDMERTVEELRDPKDENKS